MNRKEAITEYILKRIHELGDAKAYGYLSHGLDKAMVLWWWDNRSNESMRLSMAGEQVFTRYVRPPVASFDLDRTWHIGKNVLLLDRNMKSPYSIHIKEGKINVFGPKEVTAIIMCGSLRYYFGDFSDE